MQQVARTLSLTLAVLLASCGRDPCDESWLWKWDRAGDLRECAEKGHRDAQRHYGRLLALNGHSAQSNVWLNRATRGRDAKGAMEVARGFARYDGDRQLAAAWYRRAFEMGEREAAVRLGMLHHEDGNRTEADRWFERAVASGDSYTAGTIGFLLSHDQADAAISAGWYKRAAEMGDYNSMGRYAHLLQEGRGVTRDFDEAFRWRHKAATHAKADGYALLALARSYDEGLGTRRNPGAALAALRAAEGKWIDDSDTNTPHKMKEMEARLAAETSGRS